MVVDAAMNAVVTKRSPNTSWFAVPLDLEVMMVGWVTEAVEVKLGLLAQPDPLVLKDYLV